MFIPEENAISFIETSALNSMNVEKAFQTILAGKYKIVIITRLLLFQKRIIQ